MLDTLCYDCCIEILSYLRYNLTDFDNNATKTFGYFTDDTSKTIYRIFNAYKRVPTVHGLEPVAIGLDQQQKNTMAMILAHKENNYLTAIKNQAKINDLCFQKDDDPSNHSLIALPCKKEECCLTVSGIHPFGDGGFIVGLLIVIPDNILDSIEEIMFCIGGHSIIHIPNYLFRWLQLNPNNDNDKILLNTIAVPEKSIVINLGSMFASLQMPYLNIHFFHAYSVYVCPKNKSTRANYRHIVEQVDAYMISYSKCVTANQLEAHNIVYDNRSAFYQNILQFTEPTCKQHVNSTIISAKFGCMDSIACALFIRWRKTADNKSMPKYIACMIRSEVDNSVAFTSVKGAVQNTESIINEQLRHKDDNDLNSKCVLLDAEKCLLNEKWTQSDELFPELPGIAPWTKNGDEPDTYWYCVRFTDKDNAPSTMHARPQCSSDILHKVSGMWTNDSNYAIVTESHCSALQADFFLATRNITKSQHGMCMIYWSN